MNIPYEHQYGTIMNNIRQHGYYSMDRTGVGTRSLFNQSMTVPIYDHECQVVPLLHCKAVHVKSVIHELLWFISGSTNIKYLQDNDVTIWNEWADEDGELGPVYGHQWRKGKDQLQTVIDSIKTNPYSRRHLVSAWNVDGLEDMKLPPCHYAFQFHCYVDRRNMKCLDMTVNMRSADWFLGVPFNMASYAILAHMVGELTDREARNLSMNFGNAHLYDSHHKQVDEYLDRTVMIKKKYPNLFFNRRPDTIDEFRFEDFQIFKYEPMDAIKAPIAV